VYHICDGHRHHDRQDQRSEPLHDDVTRVRPYLFTTQSAFYSVCSRLRSVGGGFSGAMTTQCWRWRRRWRRRRRLSAPTGTAGDEEEQLFFSVVEDTGSRCFPPDRYSRVCVPANPHAHPPTRKRPGRHLSRARGTLRFHTTYFSPPIRAGHCQLPVRHDHHIISSSTITTPSRNTVSRRRTERHNNLFWSSVRVYLGSLEQYDKYLPLM